NKSAGPLHPHVQRAHLSRRYDFDSRVHDARPPAFQHFPDMLTARPSLIAHKCDSYGGVGGHFKLPCN
ncbi:MAG: hypothetical protein WB543_06095, partial [Candidatus Acidiferrum sp.]